MRVWAAIAGACLAGIAGVRSAPAAEAGGAPWSIEVDASRADGRLRSLLGVNRGPVQFPRRPGERSSDFVAGYREMGIDSIRTHDFYGPTDWHVIFPDWSADPSDPAAYDFASSDARIRAIVTNGFRCFFRLGTSWKGNRVEPVNDPPGTRRDASGRVTHVADRADFRKWASICVQTVRHYTEGWKDGHRFPIDAWEIWNEPDLAAQFWTGTPGQYYAMYEEAARAIKRLNPRLKVGGAGCTGALREPYVEGFIRHCREHDVPLDFLSWHSYGGRGGVTVAGFVRDARRIRAALDAGGFPGAESVLSEWNAGIKHLLFNDSPRGAAFYASLLGSLQDAGVDRAFLYCGDAHPGLGLHDMEGGRRKICGDALVAWKALLETPERLPVKGGDDAEGTVMAGRSADGRRVRILVSDPGSAHAALRLKVQGLPWPRDAAWTLRRWEVGAGRRWGLVEEAAMRGAAASIERPFRPESLVLIELERGT